MNTHQFNLPAQQSLQEAIRIAAVSFHRWSNAAAIAEYARVVGDELKRYGIAEVRRFLVRRQVPRVPLPSTKHSRIFALLLTLTGSLFARLRLTINP